MVQRASEFSRNQVLIRDVLAAPPIGYQSNTGRPVKGTESTTLNTQIPSQNNILRLTISKYLHHPAVHCQANALQPNTSLTPAAFPGHPMPGICGKHPLEVGVP